MQALPGAGYIEIPIEDYEEGDEGKVARLNLSLGDDGRSAELEQRVHQVLDISGLHCWEGVALQLQA